MMKQRAPWDQPSVCSLHCKGAAAIAAELDQQSELWNDMNGYSSWIGMNPYVEVVYATIKKERSVYQIERKTGTLHSA